MVDAISPTQFGSNIHNLYAPRIEVSEQLNIESTMAP
ncbi:hypothetical protein EDF62_3288 [Leucobacter luti]|uniref:Uncharacterized protein n=1 Tax=Leucobacter luti TaxID=340320 RepID=A0A4R6RS56_9MICO|nr:hypothetical protein EDF62_3288 [Leucobacter luti]